MTKDAIDNQLKHLPLLPHGFLIGLFYDKLDDNGKRVFTKTQKTYRSCLSPKYKNSTFKFK